MWGIGLRADDPRAKGPRQWRGKFCSVRRFLQFAKKFATLRPGWQTRPPLVGSVLPRGMLESTNFRPRRSRARRPRPALAEALLGSFRSISQTHQPTKARKPWRYLLASALALRYQNTAPASSGVTLDDVSLTTKFAIHSGGEVTQVRGAPRYGFSPNLHPTWRLRSYAFGSGIYLIRAGGLNAPSSPIPGVGLGGLMPRTESAVLGGLPFTSTDFCKFAHSGNV